MSRYVLTFQRARSLALPLALSMVVGLTTNTAFAQVFAGEDFDGGTTNGGFTATTQTLTPDTLSINEDTGQGFNALFAETGSRFDRFGIANVAVADDSGRQLSLPFDAVDASLTFPGDQAGAVRDDKLDNFFIITDVENGDNNDMTTASASWTFDIAGRENLSIGIDMSMQGDFGSDSRGILDRFNFQYSIDGGPLQSFFNIASLDQDLPYSVTTADGMTHFDTGGNFFFDQDEFAELGCLAPGLMVDNSDPNNPVLARDADGNFINDPNAPGVANSCAAGEIISDATGATLRVDARDQNRDGAIYITNGAFTDDPIDPSDPSFGRVLTLGETNSFGTFVNPEFELLSNPLTINGDADRTITNQLTNYSEDIAGNGSTLTIQLDVEQVGGDQFFVFDNITVSESASTGGLACDFDGDGQCDSVDIDLLYANFGAGGGAFDVDQSGNVDAADISAWLDAASSDERTLSLGDVNLDGSVNSTDLGILLNNFGDDTGTSFGAGNLNNDATVDSTDLGLLLNAFGFTSASTNAVPEPGSFGMLLGCLLLAAGGIRSKR